MIIIMRMFGILDTVDNLNLDLFNNRIFYTMLLGALMFNYFYVIMFGGLTLMYNIITGFSMSSLVIGYFIHYAVPFEPEDFNKITSELKDRIRDDADKMFKNLNIGWTTSITTDTTIEENEVSDTQQVRLSEMDVNMEKDDSSESSDKVEGDEKENTVGTDNIDEILDKIPLEPSESTSERSSQDGDKDENTDESDDNNTE